jgi:spore maturation protein CgeB
MKSVKASYYLEHEDERQALAAAGQQRALKDHTIKRRMDSPDRLQRSNRTTGKPKGGQWDWVGRC